MPLSTADHPQTLPQSTLARVIIPTTADHLLSAVAGTAAWYYMRRRRSGAKLLGASRFERFDDGAWNPGLEMTRPGGGTSASLMGGNGSAAGGSFVPPPVSMSAQHGGYDGAPLGVVVQPWGQQQEHQNGGTAPGQLSHRDVNPFA